ncbi:MAG: hypothetical protein HZB29_01995 [Nitrospinae bacterium]|nr:hypothetical protein [Nitrospinota bacterium]
MAKLPIMGRGLDAIIRDTVADSPRPAVDPEEIARLKKAIEEEVSKGAQLAARLGEKEVLAEKLSEEVKGLRGKLDEEIPQGPARDILVETMRQSADKFDKAGNLLDAFHLYRRILRIAPDDIGALKEVATIYYSAGFLERAAECLRMIVEIEPSNAKTAENLAAIEEEMRRGE